MSSIVKHSIGSKHPVWECVCDWKNYSIFYTTDITGREYSNAFLLFSGVNRATFCFIGNHYMMYFLEYIRTEPTNYSSQVKENQHGSVIRTVEQDDAFASCNKIFDRL